MALQQGHPDKICDQVSDAVLDACLKDDSTSRVACETCTKTGMVMIFGEISTNSNVNYEQVIRDALKDIGYDDTAKGLDYKTCSVVVAVEEQSPDIAQSVDATRIEDIGAGDQGIMFGYATDETENLMPLSHELSTQIGARLTEVRKKGICEWARPDGKTQVTRPLSVGETLVRGKDAPVHSIAACGAPTAGGGGGGAANESPRKRGVSVPQCLSIVAVWIAGFRRVVVDVKMPSRGVTCSFVAGRWRCCMYKLEFTVPLPPLFWTSRELWRKVSPCEITHADPPVDIPK